MYLFSICIVCCEVSGKENWQSAYTSVNSLSDMQLLFFRWLLLLLHETCPHVWSWSWIRVQSNVYQNIAKGMKIQWTLINPALVGPYNPRAPFSYLTLYCPIVNESSGPKRVTHHMFYSVQKIAVVQRKKRVVLTLPHRISNPKSLISLQPTKAFMRFSWCVSGILGW